MSDIDTLLSQRAAGGVASLAPSAPAQAGSDTAYQEYIRAFNAAPDAATKVRLGNQYASALQGASADAAKPGPASQPNDLDALLSQRASGATVAAPSAAPTRSFVDQAGDAAAAFGHHLMRPIQGAAQLIENGVAAPFRMLPDNPISRAVIGTTDADNRAMADWEAAYQQGTPDSAGAYAGATAGEVLPFLATSVPRGLAAAGDYLGGKVAGLVPGFASRAAPAVARLTSGAAQGAAMGAVQPDTAGASLSDLVTGAQPASYWDQKVSDLAGGAAFGGAFAGATGLAGSVIKGATGAVRNSPLLNPQRYASGQLTSVLGDDTAAIIGALQGAPSYVPGSVPTAAQAAADPRLVMVEKALANKSPSFQQQMQNRNIQNNAARWDVINGVAQTPEQLQAAIASRDAATRPMRDFTVTNGNPVPVDGIKRALSSLADGSLGVRPTIGGAANGMRSTLDDITTTTPPDTLLNLPGSSTAHPAMLDALRQNANGYLAKYAPNGYVGTQEQAAMAPVKSAIIDAINGANPGRKLGKGGWGQGLPQAGPEAPSYRDYLTAFAKRSVPINTMQLAQALSDSLDGKAADASGAPLLTLTGYSSKLAQALRNSPYDIDPVAQAALEGVQDDLQRATISNSIRSPGSDTAYNNGAGSSFLGALGAASDDPGFGKLAAAGGAALLATGSPKAAGAAIFGAKKLGAFTTGRVQDKLADLMLDPKKLADALKSYASEKPPAAPAFLPRLSRPAAALALQLQKSQAPQPVTADGQ